MFDPQANAPVLVSRDAVDCYGKRFPFTPHDKREREAAIRQAKQYGAERQHVMRQQAGRQLTMREEIRGELELPTERSKPTLYSQVEHDPNRNPWRDRLAELRRQVAYTSDEKARLRTRIDFVLKKAETFDDELAARQTLENLPEDDDIVRLRKHATDRYEQIRSDPTSTIADIVARKRLVKMANSDDVQPGEYWHEVRLLDPKETPEPADQPAIDTIGDLRPIYQHQ